MNVEVRITSKCWELNVIICAAFTYFVLYAKHTLLVLLVPGRVVQSMHIGTCITTMMNDLLIKDYKFLARINLVNTYLVIHIMVILAESFKHQPA